MTNKKIFGFNGRGRSPLLLLPGILILGAVLVAGCSKKGSDGSSSGGGFGGGAASAVNAEGQVVPTIDFHYYLSEDGQGIKITDYTGNGGALVIPATIEDMPVVEIGGGAFRGKYEGTIYPANAITSVVVPDSVETIGNYAFAEMDNLASIKLSNGLKVISEGAFRNSEKLTAIVVPDSVETIGNYAFANNGGLTSVKLPDGLKAIPAYAFSGCEKLTTVNLPAGLETIREYAFSGCGELNNLIIPASLTSVKFFWGNRENSDNNAFRGCGKLPIKTTRQTIYAWGYKSRLLYY